MSSSVNQLYEILISIGDETEYNEHKVEIFSLLNTIKREIRFKNITKEDINRVDPKMTKILMDSVRVMDMDEDKQDDINTIHDLWLVTMKSNTRAWEKHPTNREEYRQIPMKDFFKRLDRESYARTKKSSSRRKSPAKSRALSRSNTGVHPFARGKSRKNKKSRKRRRRRH